LRQYHKNVGRQVRVTLQDGSKHEGTLLAASDTAVQLTEKVKEKGKKARDEEREIPFTDIKETKVLISFK